MAGVLLFALLWAMVARASGAGECNQPPKLENGSLRPEYLQQKTFASGSRVSYECNPGYTFAEGSRHYITCNEGVWQPLQATCTLKSCGSPGEIMNGYYQGGNTFGSTVTFYCNEGYTLVGKIHRLCDVDGWTGQVPTCEVVKCPDIPAIENGRISRPPTESWEYGMVAEFSCEGDYSLIGERKLTCKSDGSWNHPFPKCKERQDTITTATERQDTTTTATEGRDTTTTATDQESIPLYQKVLFGLLAVVVIIVILLVIVYLYKRNTSCRRLTTNKKRDPESGEAHSNQMKPLAAAEGAK